MKYPVKWLRAALVLGGLAMANFFVAGNVDSVMADPTLNKRCINAHQPEAVCEDFPLTYCHFASCVDTALEP